MKYDHTIEELRELTLTTLATNLRPHFSLYESAIASNTLLNILRTFFAHVASEVERTRGCKIAVVCFGSLARFEFVPGISDLDVLLLHTEKEESFDQDSLRSDLLVSLARGNPWLALDDRPQVLQAQWDQISNVALKYPVMAEATLVGSSEALPSSRRWQMLLESRCLYGDELYGRCYEAILPRTNRHFLSTPGGLARFERTSLARGLPDFLTQFDKPALIYKTVSKYWKSRLLREVYQFANIANLLVGHVSESRQIPAMDDLRAPPITKLLRLMILVDRVEESLKTNPKLEARYAEKLREDLRKYNINEDLILVGSERHNTATARLFAGLIIGLVGRYARSRELLYDHEVNRRLLAMKDIELGPRFWPSLTDPNQQEVFDDLRTARLSCARYMAVLSGTAIPIGLTLSTHRSQPRAWEKAMEPFKEVSTW